MEAASSKFEQILTRHFLDMFINNGRMDGHMYRQPTSIMPLVVASGRNIIKRNNIVNGDIFYIQALTNLDFLLWEVEECQLGCHQHRWLDPDLLAH